MGSSRSRVCVCGGGGGSRSARGPAGPGEKHRAEMDRGGNEETSNRFQDDCQRCGKSERTTAQNEWEVRENYSTK